MTEYEKPNNEQVSKSLSIFDKVQAAEIAEAKSRKCNRNITELDKEKLAARRGIEIHAEEKRLMEMFQL